MGRPRGFNLETVVQEAMLVFWKRGFQATTVGDLCEVTGLLRGSLYAAVSDKRGLFLAALDRYAKEGLLRMAEELAAPGSPRDAIRNWLLGFARDLTQDAAMKGCFLTNTAIEMLPHDQEVADCVQRTFSQMRALLEGSILRAKAAHEIAPDVDAQIAATFLLGTFEGMGVLGKTGPTAEQMIAHVDFALRALS